ncbi:MAG: insulinase family protein [Planctomycetales bacterium]|nr:insulinase family protein [Planctomycetales bacterium]
MTLAENSLPSPVTSIEGITEYRLSNGAQILLFPDASKSAVTVNMTVFVGSRHEGYGEAGMAHLLEHMLFKGTPNNENIADELTRRGASFNGTTWLDRTNYYETLPASTAEQAAENLEYALRLEADRLMNSYVRGEDLVSEMTVVRNEFEAGENNPTRVLMQRIHAAAFEWHNYGRSTIGNRSDIERVPIDRLQRFYRKFYRPDNIMVVVAGRFDVKKALALVSKYFDTLSPPETPLDRTYTTEPAQDGERTVVLRRVGNTQFAFAAYHVPSGANREFACVEMLAYIFGAEPTGRLYVDLVKTELATDSFCSSLALHDPGLILFGAQIPINKSLESARTALVQTVESVGSKPISEQELERAKRQFTKDRDRRAANSTMLAIELSEWAAQGDWRLYFLFRDYIEQITTEECTQAARQFLNRNNRTVGLFIPAEESERVHIPAKPDLASLLSGYQGRTAIQEGEEFDSNPLAIEARTLRGKLSTGLSTALLPKRTRGGTVNVFINLRYGNEDSLGESVVAADFLPEMLLRGTQELNYEQLKDRLDELSAQVRASGTTGLLSLSIETKRESLAALMPLIGDMLRRPILDENELDLIKRSAIAAAESSLAEPRSLANIAIQRALSPFDKDNIRYVHSLEESIEQYGALNIEDVRHLHSTQLNGVHGELTAVGDFDPDSLLADAEKIFDHWTSEIVFSRIETPANISVVKQNIEIQVDDKDNAVFVAGHQIAMRDDHPDYAPLLVGNYVFGGGGSLASRLGSRVRQDEGLSYQVGSNLSAHPIDVRTNWAITAITNPDSRDLLVDIIGQELERLLESGITLEELETAKAALLQRQQLDRTSDRLLVSLLARTVFTHRTLEYYRELERQIQNLELDAVNAAVRRYLQPERMVVVTAGDFAKATAR